MIITTLKRYSLIYSRRSSVKNVKQFMSCFYFKPFTTLRKIRPLYAVLESHMWHGPDHQPFWFHSDRKEATPLTSSPCRKHTTLKATYRWWQPEVVPINDKRSCLLPERWIRSDSPKPKPTLFLTVRGKKKISNLETGWRVPTYHFNVMLELCETCPPKIMSSFFRATYFVWVTI